MVQEKAKDFKVPALEKGLQILETLSSATEPMSLTDICNALGKGPSELFRMIGFLENKGYIAREHHSGNYLLTLKLYELAHLHSPVEQLIRAAAIPMRELALAIRESCHLSVLQSGDLLVLYQQESPEKFRFSVEVGARFDALHTVSGRLLLAHLPPREQDYYLERHQEYQSMTAEEQQQVLAELEQILEKGYSHKEQETHLGITDTAVLVGNPHIGLMAALAVPKLNIFRKVKSDDKLLQAMQSCAREITAALGFSAPHQA